MAIPLAGRSPAFGGHPPPITFNLQQILTKPAEEHLKAKCDPPSSHGHMAVLSEAPKALPMLCSVAPCAKGCKVQWVALKHMQGKHPGAPLL